MPPPVIAAALAAPTDHHLANLGAATLLMHQALRRVADLWGPCPAGPDDGAIFTAGPAFGTLADLRAVETALALVEARANG
jgi:hypothetical protein